MLLSGFPYRWLSKVHQPHTHPHINTGLITASTARLDIFLTRSGSKRYPSRYSLNLEEHPSCFKRTLSFHGYKYPRSFNLFIGSLIDFTF